MYGLRIREETREKKGGEWCNKVRDTNPVRWVLGGGSLGKTIGRGYQKRVGYEGEWLESRFSGEESDVG